MLMQKIVNNAPIKIISVIFGYLFWNIVSQSHVAEISLDVPLCFYKVPDNITLDSPEKIKIHLSGKRADLDTLDIKNLAAHLNMQDTEVGKQTITLQGEELFLPESIKLVRYTPANIVIFSREKTVES